MITSNQTAERRPVGRSPHIGIHQTRITGRHCRITTHRLCLAWWLHVAGHLTRRQLRVFFAAHEMVERRRYAAQDERKGSRGERTPRFTLEELRRLLGGSAVDSELAADLEKLRALGLVRWSECSIRFAVSVDEIALDDITGFWVMMEQVPNRSRSVPVPRRTLRALAAGFSRAVTAVMLAHLVRGLFWHESTNSYRVDNRTKGSWISDVFSISRRAVTDAHATLIELGWLEELPSEQWELNRWGVRSRIKPDWTPAIERDDAGGSASPDAQISPESASPCLNKSSLPTEDLKTRNLCSGRTGMAAGDSIAEEGKGGRKKSGGGHPSLADVMPADLAHNERTSSLFAEAVQRKLIRGSEAGRLDFFSLAERARAHGKEPGRLFTWLLRNKRFDYITQADEDRAADRIRTMRDGERRREPPPKVARPSRPALSDDSKFVGACIRVAQERRVADPFLLAHRLKRWTREQWDQASARLEEEELARFK